MPSTVIDSFRHDPETNILTVIFRTGRVYRYFAVPRAQADALRAASSKGRYFNTHIRNAYPYEEVANDRGRAGRQRRDGHAA